MTATTLPVTGIAALPEAPISAYPPADWHDVPKGFYAIPVHDWSKFGNECGMPGDPAPKLDLLGYKLFTRKVPREIRTGRKAGQRAGKDEFIIGNQIVAPDAAKYEQYTPWERLKQEIRGDRFVTEHDYPAGSVPCRCTSFCAGATRDHNADGSWMAVPGQRQVYANTVAAVILDGIRNHDDIYRRLYGHLTGQCGICGRLLTDPESKLRGIGPDCWERLAA